MLPPLMSEDHPSTPAHRSWFERLSQALSGEPRNIEELLEELRQAQANGLLSNDTLSMVEGAIEVADLTVADVMVPRGQVVSLAANAPFQDNLAIVIESGHSRFPVRSDEKDEILGILLAKDLLRCLADGVPADIRKLLRPVALIPASKKLNVLLKEFRLSHNHMAIVVDEYGGVAGLITIEDVLEQIVGDIDDEHDDADEGDSRQMTEVDGCWLVNALTPIGEFNERFGSTFLDEEYDTVGGLITAEFGHLPEAGEEISLGGFDFHVTKADDRRIHQVRVSTHAS